MTFSKNATQRTYIKKSRCRMNAFWLLLPLLAIRFIFIGMLDKQVLKRTACFPPLMGKEKLAYYPYLTANKFLFLYSFFLEFRTESALFGISLAVCGLGNIVCAASVFSFTRPDKNGINLKGIYRISRNPMYMRYFIYFLGCVLLMRSISLFAVLIVFQIATHWIMLSEER